MNPDRLKKTPASSPAPSIDPPAAPVVSPTPSGAATGPVVTGLDPITQQVLADVTVATNGEMPKVFAPVLSSAPAKPVRKVPFAPLLLGAGALLCGAAALTFKGRHV
ncbi:hypothetical protein [Deinococcus misasensis]|uniref:hypothetical protein n=1 Tax=Deinococcus misasensis TaxID=392413 RepID=UPI0005595650|nr:hypothetical protein [Deinococcus misasensis]